MLGSHIAAELSDITRFASAKKLCGYTGLSPSVDQSGSSDHRGPLANNGPTYLRWALIEATTHAARHACYRDHDQATMQQLGRQRGVKVARVESPASSPRPSGTCSPAQPALPRQGPRNGAGRLTTQV